VYKEVVNKTGDVPKKRFCFMSVYFIDDIVMLGRTVQGTLYFKVI